MNNVHIFVSTRLEMKTPSGVEPTNDVQYLHQNVIVSHIEGSFPDLKRRTPVVKEVRVWAGCMAGSLCSLLCWGKLMAFSSCCCFPLPLPLERSACSPPWSWPSM